MMPSSRGLEPFLLQRSINLYLNVKIDGPSGGGGTYFGELGVAGLMAHLMCQSAAES